MNISPEHIDELIASFLAGEASAEESAWMQNWIAANDANRRYFEQMKLIFEKAPRIQFNEVDTNEAWQKVRARIRPQAKTVDISRRWVNSPLLKIAAAVIVVMSIGLVAYNFFDNTVSVEVLSDQSTASDTLPDGSDVFLNRQTRIEYVFDKKENVHRAKLQGEAYFNINHDDAKTFIVEAEGTFIKDIGTSFNVQAYPGSPTIEVVVEEGEVMFYTESDPGIYLKAKGRGIYNKDTRKFTIAEPEPNIIAYKTKFFSFSDHSLQAVVETLNDVYPTQIEIDEGLKNCRLTVSFNDEDIDEIAQVIAETLGLTVSKSGNVINLKGAGCGEGKP